MQKHEHKSRHKKIESTPLVRATLENSISLFRGENYLKLNTEKAVENTGNENWKQKQLVVTGTLSSTMLTVEFIKRV